MQQTVQPVKMAVIGPGRMGRIYARLADELATTQLVAVCGRSEASTLALAEERDVPAYPGSRYREMLAAHPDIEAVIVATSEWAHLDPVLAALEAGRHVLVEKPMATSPADAAQMNQRAKEAGLKLMVCHNVRFDPRYALMQQAVVQGEIGTVLHMQGRRNPLQRAVDRVLGQFPLAYWLLPHHIDIMLWTANCAVRSVRAYSRAGGRTRHDFIIATLTFEDGALGIVECSWGAPDQSGRPQMEFFVIHGTAGSMEVLGYENGLAFYRADHTVEYPDTVHSPVVNGQLEGTFRSLMRHFAGVVRDVWPPLITGDEGLAVIRVAAAIDRSLAEGREVPLAEME